MTDRLVYRYRPTGRELALDRLAQSYGGSSRATPRLVAGPALLLAGLVLRAAVHGGAAEGLGAIAIGYGLFLLLRPLVWFGLDASRRGRASSQEVTVTFAEDGVRVAGGGRAAHLAWKRVDEVTRLKHHYQMTTSSGVRWSFPTRAVDDESALVRMIRAQGKWRPPD